MAAEEPAHVRSIFGPHLINVVRQLPPTPTANVLMGQFPLEILPTVNRKIVNQGEFRTVQMATLALQVPPGISFVVGQLEPVSISRRRSSKIRPNRSLAPRIFRNFAVLVQVARQLLVDPRGNTSVVPKISIPCPLSNAQWAAAR